MAIDPSRLITGTIKLADLNGTSLVGRQVTVTNVYDPLVVDGSLVAGASKTVTTDAAGAASVNLVRGALVDVTVSGTSIVRRIQVPTEGTTFNLLDPALQKDDPFGIQVPDLPAAPRNS